MSDFRRGRRIMLAGMAGSVLAAPSILRAAPAQTVRIGYQKNGTLLVLKQQGSLDTRLDALGVKAGWFLFPSGPPMLEAMNADSVDFGATGDTPPIFAQAAGADLLYVAHQPVPGVSLGIVVHKDGPIRTLADLRGRRIAVTKGSSAHAVLVRVLAHAGIGFNEVTPVYLQPPDATAAFRQGSVDAWSIWDPFFAIAEADPETRLLTTAAPIAPSNSFFLARRAFAAENPKLVETVLDEVARVTSWLGTHQEELARTMADATGVPLAVQRIAAARGNYVTAAITPQVIAEQQGIADTFRTLGLIPRPIRVADAVWRPGA